MQYGGIRRDQKWFFRAYNRLKKDSRVVDICIWAEQFPELNALPRFRLRASLQPCVKKSSDMKQDFLSGDLRVE